MGPAGWSSLALLGLSAFRPKVRKRTTARPRNNHRVMLLRSMNPFGRPGARLSSPSCAGAPWEQGRRPDDRRAARRLPHAAGSRLVVIVLKWAGPAGPEV